MKYCPMCHANIDGLLHRCDCCGFFFSPRPFFTFYTFETPASGDLGILLKMILSYLNHIDTTQYTSKLTEIEFEVFGYPCELLQTCGKRIKNNVRFYSLQKKVRITIIINYEQYIHSDKQQKILLILTSIKDLLIPLRTRMKKEFSDIDNFIDLLSKALSDAESDLIKAEKGLSC